MKEQSSVTCHTTEREKISRSKILAHLFQKKLKTIHIHKTEGSPEHSQHLGCQWRRELVTTYDSCSLGPIATYAAARRSGAPHKVG